MKECYLLIGQNLKETKKYIKKFKIEKVNIAFTANNSDLYQKLRALPYEKINIIDFTSGESTLYLQEVSPSSREEVKYINQIHNKNHLIFHSSGSVDGFKWIYINQKNINYVTENISSHLGLCKTDQIAITAPLFHSFGMNIGLLTCLQYDIPFVHFSEIEKDQWIQEILKDRFTHIYGVPTIWEMMRKEMIAGHFKLKNLRGGIIGGAKVSKELFDFFYKQNNVEELTVGYGLTECSPILTHTKPGDGLLCDGDIGVPFKQTELLIKSQELRAKGPQTVNFITRAKDSDLIIEKIEEVITGDIVSKNNQNYIYQGRTKETLERGGEKICLEVIENTLYRHLEKSGTQFKCFRATSEDKRFNDQLGIAYTSTGKLTEDEFQKNIIQLTKESFGSFFGNISFLRILQFPTNSTGKYIRQESELLKRRVA